MRYPSPYWRDEKIGGWINLFANTNNLREKCRKLGFQNEVNLSEGLLNSNTYLRYINSKSHQNSKTLENLTTSNIIIQYVPIEKISDDKEGRLEVKVIGEGIAKVFYGGHYFVSKWVKDRREQEIN